VGLINQAPTEELNPYRNDQAVGLMNQAPTLIGENTGLINQTPTSNMDLVSQTPTLTGKRLSFILYLSI